MLHWELVTIVAARHVPCPLCMGGRVAGELEDSREIKMMELNFDDDCIASPAHIRYRLRIIHDQSEPSHLREGDTIFILSTLHEI